MAVSGPTKRSWDPWKMFDVSPDEMKAIQERAQVRATLKAEWQKKVTNPYRGASDGGYIFDPAVQRFMSMRATNFDHFKATPKTVWAGIFFVVVPAGFLCYKTITLRAEREKKYRAGLVPYKDRDFKFMY
ncbi:uncharacterized protein LOC121371024 [Gigantopelta aegis]|uniref:uncharacterized protein LOC121371024 n=1 Tax=Gigantopelta aegis TaxID=1735272 RepID=UPI001B888716|nr:uncharacterized protein LOC121371024 [Gigantopelta aegis]